MVLTEMRTYLICSRNTELVKSLKTSSCISLIQLNLTGNLSEEDSKVAVKDMTDPYANDPRRHPALQPRSMKPYNAETPLKLLADNFLTPK
jgi:hypothetical protein